VVSTVVCGLPAEVGGDLPGTPLTATGRRSSVRAPRDDRESFALAKAAGAIPEPLAAELRDAVGLRDVLTHEYTDVDLARVAQAVPRKASSTGPARVARFPRCCR
jgi:hypothetical protein